MPRLALLTFSRLIANSPAGTSSAIDIAICTVASVARNRFAVLAPDGCPAWFLRVVASSGLVLCSAGNRPNSSPVLIASRPANPSMRGSSLKVTSANPSGGMNVPIRSSVHFATSTPPTAPITASSTDSVSSCRTSCQRLAPIDSRTAISAARPVPRTSSRLAMLVQAMSSTVPVTANRIISGALASRWTWL